MKQHYIDEAIAELHVFFNKRKINVVERLGILEIFKKFLINELEATARKGRIVEKIKKGQ